MTAALAGDRIWLQGGAGYGGSAAQAENAGQAPGAAPPASDLAAGVWPGSNEAARVALGSHSAHMRWRQQH